MRIIAGIHRSRRLETLQGMNTRPMMDRMKESVFNTIGPFFDDDIVLDLFGGSGALSREAISRGAKEAYIIDASKEAIKVINNNVKILKEEEKVHIFQIDYQEALKRMKNQNFDLIFLDPPYRMNIVNEIINFLIEHQMVNTDGYIICQYVKGNVEEVENLNLIKNYTYGNSEVSIYKMD